MAIFSVANVSKVADLSSWASFVSGWTWSLLTTTGVLSLHVFVLWRYDPDVSSWATFISSWTWSLLTTSGLSFLPLFILWRSAPEWMKKKRAPAQSSLATSSKKNNDLATLSGVYRKIYEVISLGGDRLRGIFPSDFTWYQLLLVLNLYGEIIENIKQTRPEALDFFFRKDASGPDLTLAELKELRPMLDMAKFAYEESYVKLQAKLRHVSYELVRLDTATEPGRVGHFIAANEEERTLVVSIKGTSSISDILTDLMGVPVRHKLDEFEGCPFDGNFEDSEVWCHEAMYTAARVMLDDTRYLIERVFLPMEHRVVVTGHSLGGGVACLLGLLLRSHIPALVNSPDRLQVRTFGTPACLNLNAALACAPFTTSVVNQWDIVPRLSLSNLTMFCRFLSYLDKKIKNKGKICRRGSVQSEKEMQRALSKVDKVGLFSAEELFDIQTHIFEMNEASNKSNLCVPGRVVAIWLTSEGLISCEMEGKPKRMPVDGVATDAIAAILHVLNLKENILSDHMISTIKQNMDSFISQWSHRENEDGNHNKDPTEEESR